MPIWILRDFERCTGCRLCEMVCSLEHEGVVWFEASRIKVFKLFPGVEIPVLCSQCLDYPCVHACPTKALSTDSETGAVIVDPSKCNACGLCIEKCPGHIPFIHPTKKYVIICDLCKGSPKCVEICNKLGFGALRVIEDLVITNRKDYAKDPLEIFKSLYSKVYNE